MSYEVVILTIKFYVEPKKQEEAPMGGTHLENMSYYVKMMSISVINSLLHFRALAFK